MATNNVPEQGMSLMQDIEISYLVNMMVFIFLDQQVVQILQRIWML